MCIILFWSDDVIFSTLTKNTLKNFNFKNKMKILKNSSCPNFIFVQKLFIAFFYKIILCKNYIFMFIMKRSISTRGSKIQHQNSN